MKTIICSRRGGFVAALAPFLVAGSMAAHAQNRVISVNLTESATDVQQINSDEVFGIQAEGSEVGGWLNLNQATLATNLLSSSGSVTSVDLSISAPAGSAVFNAAYDDTPLRGGIVDYSATAFPTSITITDLNATFANGYKVIVYVGGFNGNSGASISDETTTYYFQAADSPVAPVTFVPTTETINGGDDAAPEAQYAVFGSDSLLTDDSVTITLDTLFGGGAAIGGIQIIGEGMEPPTSGPISVNWKEFAGEINNVFDGYGVVSADNWSNFVGANSSNNLPTSGGGASTVDLATTAPGGLGTFFNAALANTPMRSGLESFNSETGPDITLSDLNATFSTYDLIVYVSGFNGAEGGNQGSVSDGTTTYYFTVPNPYTDELIESTDTDIGDGSDVGTYVRFNGLSADSTTLSLRRAAGGGVAIGAIQITGIPAVPATPAIPVVSVDRNAGTGEVTMVFESAAGVTYSAFGGTGLMDIATWPEVSTGDIVDDGGTATFSYTPPGDPSRYFLQIRTD